MTPLDILQNHLDGVSAAVMAGDWEAYRAGVDLPFHLVTAAASVAVTEEDDLRARFEEFVATLRGLHVSDFIRLATAAEFVTEDLIAGRYETEMLDHGRRVVPPYPSRIIARRVAGRWRAASIVNPILNEHWPVAVPPPVPERTDP